MGNKFETLYDASGTLSVRLEGAKVQSPGGGTYLHHRLVVGDGRPGVVVVAQSDLGLLFVRSLRVSTGEMLWEFPRGSCEVVDAVGTDDFSDLALQRGALRELLEETGFSGTDARVLGRYFTDTAVFPQRIGAVSCVVDPDSPRTATDGEVDETRWFSVAEVNTMLLDGVICDSHTLSALALLRA